MMVQHKVDLIVIGANKLEARLIKKTLSDVAVSLKDYGDPMRVENEETKKGSKGRTGGGAVPTEEYKKEAFVIWGSLEIPKLFANSH